MERGFSTLEIMIAFAILCIVLAGAFAAQYGTQYWTLTLETSGDGLAIAEEALKADEELAWRNFQSATSTPFAARGTCDDTHVCYYAESKITDLSSCAKYARVEVSWRVQGFATSSIALERSFTDIPEVIRLGADCDVETRLESWATLEETSPPIALHGTPVDIDALNGVAYVVENNPSRLAIIDGRELYEYESPDNATFNALDVARDLATGRTYAYIAATSSQLRIIDVTQSGAPVLVASTTLSGVALGVDAGWRLQYYDQYVYIATRFNSKASVKELHIFDVSNPRDPIEVGAYKLNTSAYAMLVRDQKIQGNTHRFLYLATTHTARELMVLDVSDPHAIASVAVCDLPSTQQGTALFMLGTTLYVGRQNVPNGGDDLYAFDASDPTQNNFCTPQHQIDINSDSYSRHVQGMQGTGDVLFVATNNTTNAHGIIQIRSRADADNLQLVESSKLDGLIENGIEFDGDAGMLFAAVGGVAPALHILQNAK